jgi:3-hydroxybutyryl-CoA dehydrogenase
MTQHQKTSKRDPILVVGSGSLACSIAVCLGQAREPVTLLTDSMEEAQNCIDAHRRDIDRMTNWKKGSGIHITSGWDGLQEPSLVIVTGEGNIFSKKTLLKKLESSFPAGPIIAISTDYIPLEQFQRVAHQPENIVVMNWAPPAHTTFFLELVYNKTTDKNHVLQIAERAKGRWRKDPYTINDERGVRGRVVAAMIREAFYLVQNGYASPEDIDRACRNDAGMYLPFAGIFRYMDLMGTYAYGLVMKELNKELSASDSLPDFFTDMIGDGNWGMGSGEGFYRYTPEGAKEWDKKARHYSYKIRDLIERYPFESKSDGS